jgi:hypothetical protein
VTAEFAPEVMVECSHNEVVTCTIMAATGILGYLAIH